MAEKKEIVPPKYDLDAKWDACLDLTVRRFVYSSLAGAFGGLLLFRTPVTRWASVAFGAGVGIGSAYTDCSRLFDGSPAKVTAPKSAETPAPGSTETPGPKITETPAVQEAGTEN
ncbi:hypothetical protein F2P56_026318 [Juglans regia]|uniref:MICOS complex subunit Mic10-like n=2 Tax=Juglans regia TaxID=51240 RepID=A0A833X3W9_JUGRE|nr:uncharacterized protein LOC108987672 isoform X1 [Juglans regia]KAF5456896.1 hypothetical protein F2P56_026318 [Juglans regia]